MQKLGLASFLIKYNLANQRGFLSAFYLGKTLYSFALIVCQWIYFSKRTVRKISIQLKESVDIEPESELPIKKVAIVRAYYIWLMQSARRRKKHLKYVTAGFNINPNGNIV